MMKNWENNGTGEIDLVTPTPVHPFFHNAVDAQKNAEEPTDMITQLSLFVFVLRNKKHFLHTNFTVWGWRY